VGLPDQAEPKHFYCALSAAYVNLDRLTQENLATIVNTG